MHLRAAQIFQNGMVMQRDKKLVIWGTSKPYDHITVEIQGNTGKDTADSKGVWKIAISPLRTSFEETMCIKGEEDSISFQNIAIGEVWVAGGQSNMEFPLIYERNWRKNHMLPGPEVCLRVFDVPEISFDGQMDVFDYSKVGMWRDAGEKEIDFFSAAGYYFGKEIAETLGVPVGVISCNYGGTQSQAWMSEESVRKAGPKWIEKHEQDVAGMDMAAYWQDQKEDVFNDRGLPCSDDFSRFILPEVRTDEETFAFLNSQADKVDLSKLTILPSTFPGCLYEHMVKTIAPYSARGILWYQGESDDVPGLQDSYKNMLAALMQDWRTLWADASLPFLIVQLPGWERWFGQENYDYMTIRKAQEEVADADPNAYLCSIADAGERDDIHPKDKLVVGHRLALLALGHIYRKNVLCDAPVLDAVRRSGNTVTLTFRHAEGGLRLSGNQLDSLQVLDSSGTEIDYEFAISGNKIVLTTEHADEISRIQLGQKKWYCINLKNEAGIPAIPFDATV